MRQLPNHACPAARLRSRNGGTTGRRVRVDDPAGQHRPIRLEALPGHLQPQPIQPAERRQIRAGEGSVEHVEVFLEGRCENFHPGKTSTLTPAATRQR